MPKTGIFGGTFDPPHIGHLTLATKARTQFDLDRLLWVLTPDPPHKQNQPIAPLKHRLAMLELAIADDPAFELSSVELDRPGPHYAVDTVEILAKKTPGAGLVYLMGGDSLHDLPTWRRPADLVAALEFLGVMRRPGDSIDFASLEKTIPGLEKKVRFIEAPLMDIAARQIRACVAEGRPFREWVLPQVYAYIAEQGVYQGQ